MTKHTVASLEVRIAALEAANVELRAQLETRSISNLRAATGSGEAATKRVHAKHTVQIARNDEGGWTVFHNYEPHAKYYSFSEGNKAAAHLKLSLENAEQ